MGVLKFGRYNGRGEFFLSPAILSGTPSPKLPIPPEIGPIGARKRSDPRIPPPRVVRVWSVFGKETFFLLITSTSYYYYYYYYYY